MPATACASGPLRPLASLCLGIVRGWLNVVRRGRGGQIDDTGTPWTRLPACDVQEQLEREYQVQVSTRTVQRALRELVEAGYLRREQRLKHRYRRDYWYCPSALEQQVESHRPRVVSAQFHRQQQQSQRTKPSVTTEATAVTPQVLSTHFSKTQISKTNSQKPTARTRSGPLQAAIEACVRLGGEGFGSSPKRTTPSDRLKGSNRLVQTVFVGGRAYEVADDPVTAPLR